MIKAKSVSHFDGNFRRQYPTPETFSYRLEDKWFVLKRGPRYVNLYEIVEYDAAGAEWLLKHAAVSSTQSKPQGEMFDANPSR